MIKYKLKTLFKNNSYVSELKNQFYKIMSFNFGDEDNNIIPRCEIKKMVRDKDNVMKKQIRGTGPGGQHVNKTSSAVLLKDLKTNISVKVGNSRDSVVNSGIANKRLVDKLDQFYNGSESKLAKKIEKQKKQKDRQRRKSVEKHNTENKND